MHHASPSPNPIVPGRINRARTKISFYTSQANTAAANAKALIEKVAALLPEYCAGGVDPVVVPLPLVAVPFVTKV